MLEQRSEILAHFRAIVCLRLLNEVAKEPAEVGSELALAHIQEMRSLMPELSVEEFDDLLFAAWDLSG